MNRHRAERTEEQEKKGGMKDGLVKRGSTWSFVVRVRDPKTGKMKDQWKGGYQTRKEAKAARDDARAAANKGTAVASTKITVREYLEAWLEAQAGQVRPTTLVSYKLHVESYISPRIGAERLQQLTPGMVDRLYAVLVKEGGRDRHKVEEGKKPKAKPLSATTVRRIGATLHKALADAVKKKLIPYNPADAAELPKIQRDSDTAAGMQTWTREELDKFLAHVAPDRLFPMWRLAAWTGMRRGEVAGLTWRDVDLDAGTITVQRARVTVSRTDVRESKPKTGSGRRLVELDVETLNALTAWKDRQDAERKEWDENALDKDKWPGHGLVFTYQDGAALHPDHLTGAFASHVKKAKLPAIRLHDLRHTHATLMLAAGVPVKVVSERLGHSTPGFTMTVYQHVLPGMQREAVQAVANAKTKAARHLRAVSA
ncbi:MAG: tyrosine-type recombinase/integrase [Armatimonadetes bacterium]|nr:tyrosine-type recombinase/integrase [Armatimonadota bacterium]